MRIGTNPEKEKFRPLKYKYHRIIIPVYIPDNCEDTFYKEMNEVFKLCINSILNTIDEEQTNITIINNNSNQVIENYIDELVKQKKIDKHVKFVKNYGKVYSVLQEAKGCYEEFITIADADVYFLNNWQNNAQKVFANFKNIGVVGLTPDPHMSFYCNVSLWFNSFFKIKKGNVTTKRDLELFERGINKKDFFLAKKYNWKQKQFYLKKGSNIVIVGASHFASTYRREIFNKIPFQKPVNVFPGGELNFIDIPIDKLGYYRVSLPKAFVYHMGNSIEDNMIGEFEWLKFSKLETIKTLDFSKTWIPFAFRSFVLKFIRFFI